MGGQDWMDLVQGNEHMRTGKNTVMKLQVSQHLGNFLTVSGTVKTSMILLNELC